MEEKDVKAVKTILNSYLEKFVLREVYSQKEIKHFFMPRDKVMYSWVVETDGVITDFISFYSLPSSILNHQTHKTLNVISTPTSNPLILILGCLQLLLRPRNPRLEDTLQECSYSC